MKLMPFVLGVALATCGASSPALAWWEYAKWGMSPKQLSAASKGAAVPCGAAECSAPFKNASPSMTVPALQIVGQPASVLFDFDDLGKLQATFVVFHSKAITLVNNTLSGIYGTPSAITNGWPPTQTWRDTPKGTVVRSWYFPDSNKIIIEYRPIAKGL